MAERVASSSSISSSLRPSAYRAPAVARSTSLLLPRSSSLSPKCHLSASGSIVSPLSDRSLSRSLKTLQQRRATGSTTVICAASDPAQLKGAREDIKELLKTTFCHPIMVRLGWHDAGTYDKNIEEWPQRGGANGSLRFEVELKHAANAGT